MSLPRVLSLIVISIVACCSISCVEDKDFGEANNLRPNVNRNVDINENSNIAEDSEEKLDRLINLPFTPIENSFREEAVRAATNSNRAPGPNDKRLVVVLRFSPEDTESLVEKVSKHQEVFKTDVEPETWFPAELIAKSGTSGNEQLKGTGYSAKDFAKSPWLNGSLIRIDETDYFVLVLQTQ